MASGRDGARPEEVSAMLENLPQKDIAESGKAADKPEKVAAIGTKLGKDLEKVGVEPRKNALSLEPQEKLPPSQKMSPKRQSGKNDSRKRTPISSYS